MLTAMVWCACLWLQYGLSSMTLGTTREWSADRRLRDTRVLVAMLLMLALAVLATLRLNGMA